MHWVGFDTETYLLSKANPAPKPVCCTWFDGTRRWITRPDEPATYALLARPDLMLIGHNVVYDCLVMMRWQPETVPLFIQMADEGRLRDTDLRESLRYLQERGAFGFPNQWSLADLVRNYYGVDISEGKESADSYRLRYGTLDGVPFSRWPREALDYAMDDAVWAYRVGQAQGMWEGKLPTEDIQVQGALALGGTSSWGFQIRQEALQDIQVTLRDKIAECDRIIGPLRWSGTGSEARIQQALQQAWNYKQAKQLQAVAGMHGWQIDWSAWDNTRDVQEMVMAGDIGWFHGDVSQLHNVTLSKKFPVPKRTKKVLKDTGKQYIKSDEEAIRLVEDCYFVTDAQGERHEALRVLQNRKHYNKLKGTYCDALEGLDVVHAGFRTLVSTGRTGCREPNLQNWPARDDLPMRRMFRARPGMELGTVDWGALELCTLAATIRSFWPHVRCYLGEVLDRGEDPHCLTASIFLQKPYEEILAGKKGQYKEVRQGSKACYSGDTELLTPEGWVRIDSLGVDCQVMQVSPHSKKGNFVPPLATHKYEDCSFLQFTGPFLDCRVTKDHRMLAISRAGYKMEILARDYEANEQFSSMHAVRFCGTVPVVSDIKTRVAVMVQADGSFTKGQVRLGFTKTRKINRCRELLKKAGISFVEWIASNGAHSFRFSRSLVADLLSPDKGFVKQIGFYSPESFIDELYKWDGRTVKKSTAQFFNTDRKSVDVAQTILALNGRKSSVASRHEKGKQPIYTLTWYLGDRKKNIEYGRLSGMEKRQARIKGPSYCVTVPSGWLLTRRNGKITVSGNSNFGFPGGLSVGAFLSYAEGQYGVKLSYGEGMKYFKGWCQTYPEIPGTFLKYVGDMVPRGTTASSILINGRSKADCRFTQHANFHFQGLAADGAKGSHYAIWRECVLGGYYRRRPGLRGYGCDYRDGPLSRSHPVNFVHDETVCEHQAGDKKALKRQEDIMVEQMSRTCRHLVPITVEGFLGDEWAH